MKIKLAGTWAVGPGFYISRRWRLRTRDSRARRGASEPQVIGITEEYDWSATVPVAPARSERGNASEDAGAPVQFSRSTITLRRDLPHA